MRLGLIAAGIIPDTGDLSEDLKNVVIAVDDKMPWSEPEDLKYFKKMTMGDGIICGRKTFQGMPFLEGRTTFLLSRSMGSSEDSLVFTDFESAYAKAKALGIRTLWVIGGGEVYDEVINNENIKVDYVSFTEISNVPVPEGKQTLLNIKKLLDSLGCYPLSSRSTPNVFSNSLSPNCTAYLMSNNSISVRYLFRFFRRGK